MRKHIPSRVRACWSCSRRSPCRSRAQIIEQVLVKVNGDIITKTELENRQIAAIRQRMNQDVSAEAMKNDDQLKKTIAEVTPRILVEAIDEMLMVQLGEGTGLQATRRAVQGLAGALRKEQNLEDEPEVPGGAEAGRHDDRRSAQELREAVHDLAGAARRGRLEADRSPKKKRASTTPSHQQEFTEPANVTLREILIETPAATQEGQAGVNVAQDDEARVRGDGDPPARSWPARTSPRSPPRSRRRRRSRPAG